MSSEESLTSSQPDTQPMEEDNCTASSSPDSPLPWAWLVQLRSNTGSVSHPQLHPLCGDRVSIGRDTSCTIQVDDRIFDGSEEECIQLVKLSREHFEISKEKSGITLVDLSMNGTYVNKLLVGKGNQYRLNHTDVISILVEDFSVFLYIDEKTLASLYSVQICRKYLVGREVGKGSSAVVREGFARGSNIKVAMKFICKKKWPGKYSLPQDLMKEVTILQELQHPCITKVLEVLEDENMLVIVMEFAAGGEVFDQVIADLAEKKLTEETAKLQFFQLSHTIAYLHSKHVCHRDLKLENILLMEPGPASLVKVTDFGLSKQFSSTNLLETFVGTPAYMAPEVITSYSSPYTSKSDCWSLGVILYILLSGHPPFHETQDKGLFSAITSGMFYPMKGPPWAKVSPLARDLVTKLLDTDHEKRLSAEKILDHEWFQGDRVVVDRAMEIMGLRESRDSVADSGVGSLHLGEGGDNDKRGEKRKENYEMIGEIGLWRKARESRNTKD